MTDGAAEPRRHVYAVWGVPPETQAYAMAKYSRSSQSMLESIAELSAQKAADFLETFYFQYGHRSIADLAHIALAFENISLWAAIKVVDEPLWDGQERSTRYQPFTRTRYHVPDSLTDPATRGAYIAAANALFRAYADLSRGLLDVLTTVVPRPTEMDDGAYRRTLRARAFDVARYLLPLATRTSVGQITSARVIERQISRLLADDLPECRAIAADLRDACVRPAEAPLLTPLLDRAPPGLLDEVAKVAAAPTLVKYTTPATYPGQARARFRPLAAAILDGLPPGSDQAVQLAEGQTLEDGIVTTLLYAEEPGRRDYRQIAARVGELDTARRDEILAAAIADRGRHDELLREHRAGGLAFDVLTDIGSFRDLHRHRRCVQIIRDPDPADGIDDAESVFTAGLGADGATLAAERGLVACYRDAIAAAFDAAATHRGHLGVETKYLYPLATRVRALFVMDYAEAAYIAELRTGPTGHFAYRRVAWEMYRAFADRHPALAGSLRVTDPSEPIDMLRR
ncbi:MAG: alternative thymidylate synthase [Chloroflexota bacterium]|nr:MAG: alternative thymidylate synthase [Chloroflexota bacterium]